MCLIALLLAKSKYYTELAYKFMQITLIHLEDRPRQGVAEAVAALKDEANLRVIMLTGDHESSAWRVANSVGIDEVYCGLKPEDKLHYVRSIPRDTGDLPT